jgi:hypothetical protein
MDFMVAARGYSLATAFLMLAVALLLSEPSPSRCMLASAALGLSFSANYSFAIIDGVAFLALVRRGTKFAYCTLPGFFTVLLICGYPLAHWKSDKWRDDLWWGAHSLREMSSSLIDSSLFQPVHFAEYGPGLLAALAILCLILVVVTRPPIGLLAGMTAWAAALSWLAFHFFGLPLPMGRTAIYFVPLLTLLAGTIAAAPTYGVTLAVWLRRGITLMLICVACYFLLCLRLSYFREYIWNAETEEVHAVLSRLHTKDVQCAGIYQTALNYYREVYGPDTLQEFHIVTPEITPGSEVYVLDASYWADFIAKEHLTVIYRGQISNVSIATRGISRAVSAK